jgi:AmmeMemoRadiSam system protein B
MRKAAVAGMFYPDGARQLKELIEICFAKSEKKNVEGLKAVIVPHAGYIYSGGVAAAGYNLLKDKGFTKVIVLGPSHHVPFRGAAFDNNDFWETPFGIVKLFSFPSEKIKNFPQAHLREHSIEVQLPFLQSVMKNFTICPISLGSFNDIFSEIMKQLDDKTILIISSDLSHYMPYDVAKKIDSETISKIMELKHVDYDDACGAEGINILVDIAKKSGWKPVLVDYKNSGDTAGSKEGVVGYACIAFQDG